MKKLEKILGVLILIGLILKFNIITGGNILTVFSFEVLLYFYAFLGFALFNGIGFRQLFKKKSYSELTAWRIIGAIATGIGLTTLCTGIFFKLMTWPRSNYILIAGLIEVAIVLTVALIKFFKNKAEYYTFIFRRIAIIGSVGLILLFLSDLTITKIQFRNHPRYIKAYEAYMNNPQDSELIKQQDIEYHRAIFPKSEFELYIESTYPPSREERNTHHQKH